MASCGRKIGPFDCCSVVQGDCLELMRQLPDGCVDAVITDPPYSSNTAKGARTRNDDEFGGDSFVPFQISATQIDALMMQVARIDRRWYVASMDWRHVAQIEANPPKGMRFVRAGAWVKKNSAPQFTGDRPAQGWEMVACLHSTASKMRWNGGGKRGVWESCVETNNGHPTPKPLDLMEEWLVDFTDEQDIVLDPFCGSGTTLVAAKKLGRHFLGFEISPEYCDIARKRLDDIDAQPSLFEKQPVAKEVGLFE